MASWVNLEIANMDTVASATGHIDDYLSVSSNRPVVSNLPVTQSCRATKVLTHVDDRHWTCFLVEKPQQFDCLSPSTALLSL